MRTWENSFSFSFLGFDFNCFEDFGEARPPSEKLLCVNTPYFCSKLGEFAFALVRSEPSIARPYFTFCDVPAPFPSETRVCSRLAPYGE